MNGSKLNKYVTSDYLSAAQKLRGRRHRRKVVVYVESYDDVFFWRALLSDLETDEVYFEVMLPSRTSLTKGKKCALINALENGLGPELIACVDADYDYMLDGVTHTSLVIKENDYVFHTYVYAIENFQCYAPSLHGVCVMSTLNDDHSVFDFEAFLAEYSKTIWPLFAWNVWAYKYGRYKEFSMSDFAEVVSLKDVNLFNPKPVLSLLQAKVNSCIAKLHNRFPEGRQTYKAFVAELEGLGISPSTCYLYMRGHDLMERVVEPLVEHTCVILRKRREKEIGSLALHDTQLQNELSGYHHSSASPSDMLRKHTDYKRCPQYKKIQQDIAQFLKASNGGENQQSGQSSSNVVK